MIKGNLLHSLFDHTVNSYGGMVKIIQKSPIIAKLIRPAPLVLRLRVSKRCNLKCSFCYQADSLNKKEEGHLTLEQWDKILKKLPRRTIIDITGGETFLAKSFAEITSKILNKGFRTSIITNGSYPKNEVLEKLVRTQLYYFMISVDGLEKTHNSIRGNNKSFQNILITIEVLNRIKAQLKSQYPIICLKITIAEDNYPEILDTIKFFHRKYGITDFTLNLLYQNKIRGGNYVHEDSNHRDFQEGNTLAFSQNAIEEVVKVTRQSLSYAEENNVSVRIKPEIDIDDLGSYLKMPSAYGVKSCQKQFSVLTMYYDGTLTPCDIGLDIGHIRELDYDLSKVWNVLESSNLSKELKKGFHPSCEGCCLKKHSLKV